MINYGTWYRASWSNKITRGTGAASLFLFKDTITNFGIIISVVLIQFASTQSRFQSPRYPCPAERAMTLHWTRVMQTLVTRLVLTLHIRRHIGPITLSLIFAFGLLQRVVSQEIILKTFVILHLYIAVKIWPQFYLSFKKLKTLLHSESH